MLPAPTSIPPRAEGSAFAGEARAPLALLISRQAETIAWGKKWLERFGFQVLAAGALEEAASLLGSGPAEIAVVDATGRSETTPIWTAVRLLPGGASLPVLAICANDKDARRAVLERGTDVVRRPLEWQVLSQRAVRLVEAYRNARELQSTRSELDSLRLRSRTASHGDPASPLDPLTGLPQRRAFEQVLESALAGSAGSGLPLAVLYLDLDRFKLINGTYGRLGGSQVLVQVAERLRACLHDRDLLHTRRAGMATAAVARVGGDAFCMMVSPVGAPHEVTPIAQAVLDALALPFAVDEADVYASASLGISVAPADGTTAEELLQRAELAMAEAGRRGGGGLRFYSRGLSDARQRALKMDRLLRRTLERNELSVHYQPIVEARTRRIVGAEALLRWHSPELGEVPPVEFIPVAEETGFMVEIGRWVLLTACRQVRAWDAEGLPEIRIAVNVSLCQLTRGNVPQLAEEALFETGLDPRRLELELSERGALRSDPEILRQLQALRRRGIRVSVDDFGTGDSAIAYLKRFPLDTLKVDQSFIAGALTDPDDAAITSAMIAMAHRLRLRVVAEGVEEQSQVDMLNALECEEVQGFFFSRPLPADAFRDLLASHRTARVLPSPWSTAGGNHEVSR